SNDGIEQEEDWGGGNCGKALCNGKKFLDFGNVMAIFDNCIGSAGKWKNEDDKVIKPAQTSARFMLDDGDYICRETCKVLMPKDEDGARRWEPKTVYRAGGIDNPRCVYGYIWVP
ncbi:unnamed protein product, partial [Symbiodinium necroappetens]